MFRDTVLNLLSIWLYKVQGGSLTFHKLSAYNITHFNTDVSFYLSFLIFNLQDGYCCCCFSMITVNFPSSVYLVLNILTQSIFYLAQACKCFPV